jgi:hypothetical protein
MDPEGAAIALNKLGPIIVGFIIKGEMHQPAI